MFIDEVQKLPEWIKSPVANKLIVYAGDFENTDSDVKLLNYKHLAEHLPQMPV